MNDQQIELIERAKEKYKAIYPCGRKTEWPECFSQECDQVIFWFNSSDNSTHIERDKMK